jgi:hypothetical protein
MPIPHTLLPSHPQHFLLLITILDRTAVLLGPEELLAGLDEQALQLHVLLVVRVEAGGGERGGEFCVRGGGYGAVGVGAGQGEDAV